MWIPERVSTQDSHEDKVSFTVWLEIIKVKKFEDSKNEEEIAISILQSWP